MTIVHLLSMVYAYMAPLLAIILSVMMLRDKSLPEFKPCLICIIMAASSLIVLNLHWLLAQHELLKGEDALWYLLEGFIFTVFILIIRRATGERKEHHCGVANGCGGRTYA
jgi:hypothetical protein